jgi:hypothetical protein
MSLIIAANPDSALHPAVLNVLTERKEPMKNGFLRSLCLFSLAGAALIMVESTAGAAEHKTTLSPYAEELARILKFDRQVLLMAKKASQEHIHRLTGYDENGYRIIAPGIAVPVPEDKTDVILAALRRKLLPLHYIPFVVEMHAGHQVDMIGILKGTDQYEILRVMQTNGDDDNISNQDIIARLKEWEKCSLFDIVGAENDWVELEFRSLPKNLAAFAEEVYEFSPDAVDQGWGSVDGLIYEMRKTNRLFLWWDR